ncbi:TetR/AcrR family transcriptional regulator [Rhodovulum adriaticum]|uniref:TetR family transcriptional regulator n=1 Tax=Rhodovulum adriaticum TaxID=35804 RepID=A0A4R2NLL0_RHOAD|nr:TetR/AcrR family transcriptional regulator [Rhodovulum adriaticum]TCP22440.1 TetR family transcriptional regulator [Rhodovulum adriaticum]
MAPLPERNARSRILDAAEAVALREGARHLTLDAAAREAGLSKGGVLYHFPSKQALLDGMLQRFIDMVRAEIDGHLDRFRGQANPTLRALNATMRARLQGPDQLRIALTAAHAEHPTENAKLREVFAREWETVAAETTDPAGALTIWCAIEGLQFFTLFDICPVPPAERLVIADRIDALIDALPGVDGGSA